LERRGQVETGGEIEDCRSRDFLLLIGVGGRKDLLALPTGRVGSGEEHWNFRGSTAAVVCWTNNLKGPTAGVCWNLRGATAGVCWTIREMGWSVRVKREQGGGDTITSCCALAKVSMP